MEQIQTLQKDSFDGALEKGFHYPNHIGQVEATLARLMLAVTELGEACQAVRAQDFKLFKEELADTCIRIFGTAYAMGIHLDEEIRSKLIINDKRSYMHGDKVI